MGIQSDWSNFFKATQRTGMRCLLLTVILLLPPGCAVPGSPVETGTPVQRNYYSDDVEELLFFAVLEGLYSDGIPTHLAEELARIDADSHLPAYFVYNCPLCMPAFNALRTYINRPEFYNDKQSNDTFGPGPDPAMTARLESTDWKTRFQEFNYLIQTWTDRRIRSMRLNAVEQADLEQMIAAMREKGNAILASYRESDSDNLVDYREFYEGWDRCAVCNGSLKGCAEAGLGFMDTAPSTAP